MSPRIEEQARTDAIGWHIRLKDGRAEDWEAFTAWLEQDPAHNAAYDAVVMEDDALDDILIASPRPGLNDDHDAPPPADETVPKRRWAWAAGAVAALLALSLLVWPLLAPSSSIYPVETAPGVTRIVSLRDGSEVALNGATRILLDRNNARYAALDRGEARFRVVHDEADPFVVHAGDKQIHDVGTVFNMVRDDAGLTVEVSEGAVRYNPRREAIELRAGQTLYARHGSRAVELGRKPPELIGTWKEGRLSYRNAAISTVAADLSRSLGVPVAAAPEIAQHRFTGTIRIEKDRDQLFRRLGALLGVEARPSGSGWQLSAPDRAAH